MTVVLLILGHVWSAPLTVLGLLAALVGRVSWLGMRGGVLEFVARPDGLIAWVFQVTRTCGASGMWGCVAFYVRPPTDKTRAHEHRHARQAQVLGVFWPLAYAGAALVAAYAGGNPYADNWFERDARAAGYAAEAAADR